MRKVFISAGHSNVKGKDRGAAGNGYIEGELTIEYRDMLVAELNKIGVKPVIDGNGNVLKDSINFFRNLSTSTCLVIDIHWNAAGAMATGTETFVPSASTDIERHLAKALSDDIHNMLGIQLRGNNRGLRGVKTEAESHHGRLGWMRLTGENVLLEICFISSESDMKKYQDNKHRLAFAHAQTIKKYALMGMRDPLPQNLGRKYTVKSGDSIWGISRTFNVKPADLVSINSIVGDKISPGQILKID